MLAEDPERQQLIRRWWSESPGPALTELELLQVHSILMAIFRNHESSYRQFLVGLINEEEVRAFFNDRFMGTPPFMVWWRDNKSRYAAGFVQFVDGTILSEQAGS